MLRHAAHRVLPTISLDFLAPSLFSYRRSSTQVGWKPPQSAVSNSSSVTSNATPLTSTSVLPDQPFVDDEALQSALRAHDVTKAWLIWSALQKKGALRFIDLPRCEGHARAIALIISRKPRTHTWHESELHALKEMAVFAASEGAEAGLQECMLFYIRLGSPNVALALYQQYATLMETKGNTPIIPDLAGRSDEMKPVASDPRSLPSFYYVHPNMLLTAITAYAMKDDFRGALHAVLRTNVRLMRDTIQHFLPFLGYNLPLRDKVAQYVGRISIAVLVARPGVLAKHLSRLSNDLANVSLHKLYQDILAGFSRPLRCFTTNAKKSNGLVVFPAFAWGSLMTAFILCRKFKFAEEIWDDMTTLGFRPDVRTWTSLIDAYGGIRAADQAFTVWHSMLSTGMKPDPLAYRAIMSVLFDAEKLDDCMNIFRSFQKQYSSFLPDETSDVLLVYNSTIHGLLFRSKFAEAQALLQHMRDKGPRPDIVTYNTFLRYHGRNEELQALSGVLREIESLGLVGDVFTYSIVLSAMLKIRADAVQIVEDLMKQQGVVPNVAIYSTIIDHQMKECSMEGLKAALSLLNRMEQTENARPNEVTYTSILAGLHRAKWLGAATAQMYMKEIRDQMVSRGIQPNRVTYNILIQACLENPDAQALQHALGYYREMVKRRWRIGHDTWYLLLQGMVNMGEWDMAKTIVKEIEKGDSKPTAALLRMMRRIQTGQIEG